MAFAAAENLMVVPAVPVPFNRTATGANPLVA
jgi:hypothetical protein